MPHPPLHTRFLVSGLLVAAVHAGVLVLLLSSATLRPAPSPAAVEVALLMEQPLAPPAPAQGSARAPSLPAPHRAARPSLAPPRAIAAPTPPAAATPVVPAVPVPAAAPALPSPPVAAASPATGGAAPAPAAAPAGEVASAVTTPQLDPGNPANPRPVYPATSRRLGEAGVVALRLLVNPDGRVAEARLARSSGYDRLDQAALQTVRRWTLRPARQGGEPVAAWMPYSIKFELEK